MKTQYCGINIRSWMLITGNLCALVLAGVVQDDIQAQQVSQTDALERFIPERGDTQVTAIHNCVWCGGGGFVAGGNLGQTGLSFGGRTQNHSFSPPGPLFVTRFNEDEGETKPCWTAWLGGHGQDSIEIIRTDEYGNVYLTGTRNSIDFKKAYPDEDLDENSSMGIEDVFVVKLDSSGDLAYRDVLGGDGRDYPIDMAISPDGRCYVCGYTGSADFPMSATDTGDSYGGSFFPGIGFVAALDEKGTHEWTILLSEMPPSEGDGIAVDSSGNVLISGYGPVPAIPSVSKTVSATSNKELDFSAFLMKVSPQGTILWSRHVGFGRSSSGQSLAIGEEDTIFMSGVTDSKDLPLLKSSRAEKTKKDRAFIARFTPKGDLVWTNLIDGIDGQDVQWTRLVLHGDLYVGAIGDLDDEHYFNGCGGHDINESEPFSFITGISTDGEIFAKQKFPAQFCEEIRSFDVCADGILLAGSIFTASEYYDIPHESADSATHEIPSSTNESEYDPLYRVITHYHNPLVLRWNSAELLRWHGDVSE